MKIKKPTRKKTTVLLLLIVFILLTLVLGIFLYTRYSGNGFGFLGTSEQKSVDDKDELIVKVGKLIRLPNETPDVATVTDVELLQDQSIFRNAQNGDRVLIYTESKRAIVYRPSENIIIDVGSIIISNQGTVSATLDSEEVEKEIKVAVYNATTTAGYAGRIGNELKSKFPNLQIVDTSNAAGDYEKTIVIDLTGENSSFANTLAQELSGLVDKLPESEEEPNSDILIILGQ